MKKLGVTKESAKKAFEKFDIDKDKWLDILEQDGIWKDLMNQESAASLAEKEECDMCCDGDHLCIIEQSAVDIINAVFELQEQMYWVEFVMEGGPIRWTTDPNWEWTCYERIISISVEIFC